MDQAKDWFGKLAKEKQEEKEKKTNTFKPKVLARVSHKGKWFVGSSVAVSHYLRPLCLYNRILDFKQSLKKAVVYFEPLETEDNVDWKSAAFWFQGVQAYETEKLPCENCKFMFQNLSGFLGGTDNLGEEGASAKPVGGSFLAACGEYPPINQCLPDDTESDNEAVNVAITNFRDKCLVYFKTFYSTVSKCDDAYKSYDKSKKKESEKVKILRNAYDEYVKDRIHIFGIKPECNGSLKP